MSKKRIIEKPIDHKIILSFINKNGGIIEVDEFIKLYGRKTLSEMHGKTVKITRGLKLNEDGKFTCLDAVCIIETTTSRLTSLLNRKYTKEESAFAEALTQLGF